MRIWCHEGESLRSQNAIVLLFLSGEMATTLMWRVGVVMGQEGLADRVRSGGVWLEGEVVGSMLERQPLNSRSSCISVSFACSWDSFLPTGLPCPFVSCLSCLAVGSFLKWKQKGRSDLGREEIIKMGGVERELGRCIV